MMKKKQQQNQQQVVSVFGNLWQLSIEQIWL